MTAPDLIIVTPDPRHPQHGTLRYGGRTLSCVLGRSGITRDKVEGDGATPTGQFPLRRVVYRADRGEKPKTVLPVAAIARDDGWCDAPADPAYNRPVKLPYAASAENMWRDDALYDVVVIIGHNDDPVVAQAGSAIFMHIKPPAGSATAGCVALEKEDLLWLLAALRPDTRIEIRAA
jgi:L,D-peptidoglycan transpeptidase YkuD (ErfK/YbiS/YcfS/YnhG family)